MGPPEKMPGKAKRARTEFSTDAFTSDLRLAMIYLMDQSIFMIISDYQLQSVLKHLMVRRYHRLASN